MLHECIQCTKKELKTIGQIGEPGQRDKLNFTSLDRQIHRACKRGYDGGEIVEAVIQAIIPGVSLRSYLESRTDLTLPVLKQILRAHFIEKDATELYHSFTRAVQEPKEMPIQFLFWAMDFRQRILSASENVKTGQTQINPEFVFTDSPDWPSWWKHTHRSETLPGKHAGGRWSAFGKHVI